jgi:group I intron endonuclease
MLSTSALHASGINGFITSGTFDDERITRRVQKTRGVYALSNALSNRIYIGSSDDVFLRIRHHVLDLDKGSHPNRKLANAWKKYAKHLWVWVLIEEVSGELLSALLACEQFYIDQTQAFRHGYNMAMFAGSPMKGRKHTAESRLKCAIASAKLDRSSKEYREKLRVANSGSRNHMYGKVVSDETREKLRRASTGRTHSDATKSVMSAKAKVCQKGSRNGFFGRKHMPETRQRLVENLALHRHKSLLGAASKKGRTWEDIYGPETAAKMRLAIAESNKRRAKQHGGSHQSTEPMDSR